MAVVQISRIQIRRGQKNQGSGLPQLASGELGWAIDTQELYIGNGAVSEGAPQVGNTKVITEHDNLFSLADSYIYREGTGLITTGIDSSNPITRKLQDRLDDRVSVRSFGVTGAESQDATSSLQRAIDQLYLNNGSEATVGSRVKLHLEPGIYTLTDTVYLPPHVTLVGAGSDKTIIKQTTASKAVFQTVNDGSTPGTYASDSTSTYNNQARNIHIEGMTLQVTEDSRGLVLQSCRDSYFEDIKVTGLWNTGDILPLGSDSIEDGTNATVNSYNIGIMLNSKNGGVETVRNTFVNCKIENFAYGISSNWDINENNIQHSTFKECAYGIVFGKDIIIDDDQANGTAFGPSRNIIENSQFIDISRQAILITEGRYNRSHNNLFITCGNNGGSDDQPVYSVIKFLKLGNSSEGDTFTRTRVLSYTQTINPAVIPNILGSVVYIPEVEGPSNFEWAHEHQVTVLSGSGLTLFRLPQVVNQSFDIDYILTSESYNVMRTGTITVMLNSRTDAGVGTPKVEVSDDFQYVGDETYLDKIYFDAILRDVDADGTFETLVIRSNSSMPSEDTTQFKFKVKTKQSSVVS